MNKLRVVKIVKMVATFVVASGTKTIVEAIVKNNVEPGKFREKVSVNAATWIVSGMAAEATKSYTDARIDGIFKTWLKVEELIDTVDDKITVDVSSDISLSIYADPTQTEEPVNTVI